MNLFIAIFMHDSESTAIHFGRRRITYRILRTETLKMAEVLRSFGVEPGDRVALLLNDSPEFIEAFIATVSLGAIAVPINTALRAEEQCSILHNSGASLAFMEADIRHDLLTHAPEKLQALKNVVSAQSLEGLKEQQPWTAEARFPEPADDQPAFILYTSGSTGEPKGAVHSQADIFYTNETYCREVLSLREGDRLFSSSRLPFAYGLGNAFTFPLLNGFTTVLCREKPTAEVVANVIRTYRPTIFFGVPVVYRMLLEYHRAGVGVSKVSEPRAVATGSPEITSIESRAEIENGDARSDPVATARGADPVAALNTSSLRLCISAGEALPAQLGEDWQKTFDVPVLDGIGSTEMLHMFFFNH